MGQYELDKLLKKAEQVRKEVTKSKKASEVFLKDMGVLTKGGKVSKKYKVLCTPPSQV